MSGKPRGFTAALKAVLAAVDHAGLRGVIIGAGALAAHGAPRYTEDIDILLDDASARKLVRTLWDRGWKGPPPSRDVSFYTLTSPGGVEVDVLGATEPLYLHVIEHAIGGKLLGQDVLVPSPEHYVLLKLRAAEDSPEDRLKHMSDALRLLQTKRETSLKQVSHHVRMHERDLDEVLAELNDHLARSLQPRKRPR